MKQLFTLLTISFFAFGCTNDPEPHTASSLHTIPKPGSTFTYVYTSATDTFDMVITVIDTGLDIRGKKNVASLSPGGYIAYEPNGDFAIMSSGLVDTLWLPQPVVTKKQWILPTVRIVHEDDRSLTMDYTITPQYDDDRVVDGKTIKGYTILTEELRTDYKANGEVENHYSASKDRSTWSHEIGLWTYVSINDGKNTMTLKSYDLK